MKKPGTIVREASGTTLALTTLAVLGTVAVVSTPIWIWYRRKRRRTDALVNTPPPATTTESDGGPRRGD
jgi:hypothetical protein